MMTKNGTAVLKARIEKELQELHQIIERVEKSLPQVSHSTPDDLIIGGFASYVHSFYNGLENIFEMIAEYIDNFKPTGEAWHKELLKQMTLEIRGIRPAVLPSALADDLKDYLEFRHFFRHSYSFYIKWDELKPKAENLKPIFEKLEAAFQQFFTFLQTAGEHIE